MLCDTPRAYLCKYSFRTRSIDPEPPVLPPVTQTIGTQGDMGRMQAEDLLHTRVGALAVGLDARDKC